MAENDFITVLNGAVKLRQIEDGFKTSIDAVLLAAACPAISGEHILDLGCGVGTAGLCAAARINDTHLTGLDVQRDHIDCATGNAALNNISKRCVFICGDIRSFKETGFDHVICNPPYEEAGAHSRSPLDKNATARGHNESSLEEWIKCAFSCVKSGGSLTLIHKSDQIHKIILALGKSFGATEIIPLWPKEGAHAKRVIVRTIKHRKTVSKLHSGLILHKEDGSYTDAAQAILRGGEALT